MKTRTALLSVTYLSAALSYGAVFSFVHPGAHATFLGLAALSALRHFLRPFPLSRNLLNGLAVAVMILSLSRIRPDLLVEPLVDGVLVLLGVKLLEARLGRDYLQIFLLCLFLLLGFGLLSLSISFLFYLIPLAFFLTLSLLLLTVEAAEPEGQLPRRAFTQLAFTAAAMGGLTVPVALILFVILPRTNFPLLNLLTAFGKAGAGRTGFSETVRLGEVTAIQEDAAAVFRAQTAPLPEKDLYWRGLVLDRFDGTAWSPSHRFGFNPSKSVKTGDVHQVIFMEPFGMDVLFGLDRPVSIERIPVRGTEDGTFRVFSPIFKKTRYEVWSRPPTPFVEEDPPDPDLLHLPPALSPRISELARPWKGIPSPGERIRAILEFLQPPRFQYALENLPSDLEDFLLQNRRGNCEYFASALAVLARFCGIPARLVGGYRGGYYNQAGGYYLVLQKHAHVWAEVYLEATGWVRLDPTPLAAVTPAELYTRSLLARWRVLMDTINYWWFRIVVDYDMETQRALVRRAHALASSLSRKPKGPSKEAMGTAVLIMTGAAAFVGLCFAVRRRVKQDPARDLRTAYARRLKRYGYELKDWQGVEESARALQDAALRERALSFSRDFYQAVYRDQDLSSERRRALKDRLRRL
ncbi:MAG: transglutaminaseTgpA domain-containing protein [Desulfosoma sp.]